VVVLKLIGHATLEPIVKEKIVSSCIPENKSSLSQEIKEDIQLIAHNKWMTSRDETLAEIGWSTSSATE
jgi:hypothetical protein